MRTVFFISTFVFLIAQSLTAQSETKFFAETTVKEVTVGEAFKISFVLENGKNNSRFSPPDWEAAGFVALSSSQSSNFSMINGQSTASATYQYTLSALEAGTLTIPSVGIKNGEQELYTDPITIQALPNPDGAQPASPRRNTPATPPQTEPKKRIKTIKM